MYSILHSYNAMTQQIDWEAIYSWDGFRWTRFQKEPKLMKNGPVGHFNHGGGYIMPQIVEKDGKHYLFQKYLGSAYHFEAEFLQGHSPNLDHITGDYLKKRLESRQLHSWPYFAEYYGSSWEKLAEHIKSCFYALAVIEYRKDGLFYAVADDQDAKMLTRPLTARNGLKMNTVIRDGGYLKVALVDESGKLIPGFEKEFGPADDTELKIFDQLPEGKFQIRLNLKNTEVYSLNF